MAEQWYLIKPPNEQVSGFEHDDLGTGFNDAMATGIAQDVEIYNYDLSERRQARAVVLNTVQDTKLKTLVRKLLLPIGSCVAGQYVKMKGRFWLIVGIVDDNTVYENAILAFCPYQLTWINRNGDIVQRWANIASASQYNHGESYLTNYAIRSDQLMIAMPNDEECIMLENGTRFIIDRRCKVYEKSIDASVGRDVSYSLIVYRLTRIDNVIYDYQDSGHSEFIVYQDEQQDDDGYYRIDGNGYWLCQKPNEPTVIPDYIECDSDIIYDGFEDMLFTVRFYDDGTEDINVPVTWSIECDFASKLRQESDGHSILIGCNNAKLINKDFVLTASADGYAPISKTIHIRAFI